MEAGPRRKDHDAEFWATAISNGTNDVVKETLSGDRPPSVEEIKELPVIPADMIDPGTYLGLVDNDDDVSEEDVNSR